MPDNEIDFVREGTTDADAALFLARLDGSVDPFHTFAPSERMAHLMHRAGIFKSVGEARRNGWDREIPPGFSQFRVGKARLLVTVLNLTEEGDR